MTQMRLSEIPERCSALVLPGRCPARPTHILLPGPTAHCEEHDVRWYKTRTDVWAESFATGQARIVELS